MSCMLQTVLISMILIVLKNQQGGIYDNIVVITSLAVQSTRIITSSFTKTNNMGLLGCLMSLLSPSEPKFLVPVVKVMVGPCYQTGLCLSLTLCTVLI